MGRVVDKVPDDLTGVVDAVGFGFLSAGDVDGGEGSAVVQEPADSGGGGGRADDLTGVVDAEWYGGDGTGEIDGGEGAAIVQESMLSESCVVLEEADDLTGVWPRFPATMLRSSRRLLPHVTCVSKRIATGLWPYSEAMRLLAHANRLHDLTARRVDDVDDPVIAA